MQEHGAHHLSLIHISIKLLNGLLQPTSGSVLIDGQAPGTYTHSIISYLPDKNYLNDAMKVNDLISFFADFYTDFDRVKAVSYTHLLRAALQDMAKREHVQLFMPPLQLCGDNAAMIGSQAYYEYQAGTRGKTLQNAYATADIGKNICD